MHSLPLHKPEAIDKLVWPDDPMEVSLESAALSVMTDFKKHTPLTVAFNVRASDLENLMRQAHVKMKLVLDHNDQFMGIVSVSDLTEQNRIQKAARGIPKDEQRAIDFMQPKDQLQAFEYTDLEKSTVGDVVETLKESGRHHCLVIDSKAHEIRGVISVSDIARILRIPLDIQTQPTFCALSRVIAA